VLATLTLPDATSVGSALWQGSLSAPPVYNGDGFAFGVLHAGLFPTLTPAFNGSSQCDGGDMICDFDLSWSEFGGQLPVSAMHRPVLSAWPAAQSPRTSHSVVAKARNAE
jgi:hypothetical protein